VAKKGSGMVMYEHITGIYSATVMAGIEPAKNIP
jgi:hypothetical protein